MEEKKLVEKIINRDEKSLLQLYRRLKTPVFNYINRQLGDYHLAEEITQDVFLDFIEALRDFNFQCSIKTFIFSIAKNKVIDHIRKKKIKQVFFSALPSYLVEGLKIIFFDEELEKKELAKKIKKALTLLPNDYQHVIRQKYIEGLKVTEIAKNFRLKFKTTESLLFRARKAFVKIYNTLP